MRLAILVLARLFVPVAVIAGVLQAAGAPEAAALARSIAAALISGAITLWGFREALAWWGRRERGRAGGGR